MPPLDSDVKLYTWEGFSTPAHEEPTSAYLSEATPAVFDAAIQRRQGIPEQDYRCPVGQDELLKSLVLLALGRSSRLFSYAEERESFISNIESVPATGHSPASSNSIVSSFVQYGNTLVDLQVFAKRTYSTADLPACVALAEAVATIISTIQNTTSEQSAGVSSLIQLQSLISQPIQLVASLARLVGASRHARTNEQMASIAYRNALAMEQEPEWLRTISQCILARVCKPWLGLVEEWVGLQPQQTLDSHRHALRLQCVEREDAAPDDNSRLSETKLTFVPEALPTFINERMGQMIFETGRNLRIIEEHGPEDAVFQMSRATQEVPKLHLHYTWDALDSLLTAAKMYERRLAKSLVDLGLDDVSHGNLNTPVDIHADEDPSSSLVLTSSPAADDFITLAAAFDVLPVAADLSNDGLESLVTSMLRSGNGFSHSRLNDFAPSILLSSELSLQPLLSAQSRLTNAVTLRLFFRNQGLRHHLHLQRQYHLFGDGNFITRLTTTLFDSDLASAEWKRGVIRSGAPMGLKLGSRSTWPPASSELRLALMGILSECYQMSTLYNFRPNAVKVSNSSTELPGNLSFAIRQLPANEADRCMSDPASLYALDFLRLQYNPPSPLHLVITSTSLDKYDMIFKFLLRLIRLSFVVSHQLPFRTRLPISSARTFCVEARHFINAIGQYFFATSVGDTWRSFDVDMGNTERRMAVEDTTGTLLGTESLEGLRLAHEACLDRILFALFLRHRQQKIMELLEDIFSSILSFAALLTSAERHAPKHTTYELSHADRIEVETLYDRFRGKTGLFVTVCQGLVGKKGYGTDVPRVSGKGGEGEAVERLLVLLNFNGFYTRSQAGATSLA